MEEVVGKLKVVLFHNEDNLYSVIKIKLNEETDNKYLTLTGNFPIPNENCDYKFKGEYVKHPRFGQQFVVSDYEELLPNSEDSIIKYLSSPIFPRVGVRTASKIYNILGEEAINKINEELGALTGSEEGKSITRKSGNACFSSNMLSPSPPSTTSSPFAR